jgi:hypothetical protein
MAQDNPPIMAEDVLSVFKLDFVLFTSMLTMVLLARSLFRSDYYPPIARAFGLSLATAVYDFSDLMWKLTYHMGMAGTQVCSFSLLDIVTLPIGL